MGEVSHYPNGTFCWVDLGTPGVAGAKAFYRGLFGWETEDLPAGVAGTYTMCRLDGKDVAAIHEHPEAEGAEWSSYISVNDVDAATRRAAELAATVVMEPFDVVGAARMSLIQDPTGAAVSLWQPRGHLGARLVNEVGTWGWNELATSDIEGAKGFYTALFGWTAEDAPGPMPRAGFTLGQLLVGGVHVAAEQEGDRSRWTVSFRVADADEGAERVQQLGGRIVLGPIDVPGGRFAIVTDPAGAMFTITAAPGARCAGSTGHETGRPASPPSRGHIGGRPRRL